VITLEMGLLPTKVLEVIPVTVKSDSAQIERVWLF
jgi:hypothetical protein